MEENMLKRRTKKDKRGKKDDKKNIFKTMKEA